MINLKNELKKNKIIPVLTFDDENIALKISEALIDGGLNILEITLRTPKALACMEVIKKEFPNIVIGAGTVIKEEQIKQIKDIGVDFAVSPGFCPSILKSAKENQMPYLPAASTPSEVMNLIEHGVYFQKFFHASHSGGHKMLKTFNALFSEVDFCPTGGINENDYKEYLKLDNVVCVGGSWIVQNEDINNYDYKRLKEKTSLFKSF